MRQLCIAAAVAVGLFALAILPLTAQPAIEQAATPPAMSKALFLCRGRNGLNLACVGALAKALALDAKVAAPTQVRGRRCQADQQALANLQRRD